MDNNSENNKRKCPVCGRFAKAEAVEKHETAIEAMREALAECRQAISDKDGIIDTMKTSLSLYEAEHDEITSTVANLRSEKADLNETIKDFRGLVASQRKIIDELDDKVNRLRKRGLWSRIINKDI